MKSTPLLALGIALAALLSPLVRAADDVRFTNTLTAGDRAAAGVAQFTSDQVAVLDALVRRDTAVRGQMLAPKSAAEAPPAEFSKRLTADEQRNAGLASLPPEKVAQLDRLVDRFQSAQLARTFLAPPSFLSPSRRLTPTERKDERRVHGSFSLSYGFGKGGYSEKTGSMMVTIDDPDRNLSVTIGYTQSHVKGGDGYYIYRDPLHDDLRRLPDLREPVQP